jgi:hypothetical protein
MSSNWYSIENGQPFGPQPKADVIKAIQEKKIQAIDLLYRVGDADWKQACEYEEFTSYFENSLNRFDLDALVNAVDQWVVLKKTLDPTQFKQDGPFSQEQVLEKINRGELSFDDFGWRQGFTSWVRIGDLEDFGATKKVEEVSSSLVTSKPQQPQALAPLKVEPSGNEDTEVTAVTEIPTETHGPDLATSFPSGVTTLNADSKSQMPIVGSALNFEKTVVMNLPKTKTEISTSDQPKSQEAKSSAQNDIRILEESEDSQVVFENPKKMSRRLVLSASAVVLSLGGLFYFFEMQSEPDSHSSKVESSQLKVNTSQKVAPSPTVAVIPTKGPDTLKIVALKVNSNEPQIALETNVDLKSEIRLQISSQPEEVTEGLGMEKSLVVKRSAGEVPTVNLKDLKLVEGRYLFSAEVNHLSEKKQLYIGGEEKDLQEFSEKRRKALSFYKQKEKTLLRKISKSAQIKLLKFDQTSKSVKSSKDLKKWVAFSEQWKKDFSKIVQQVPEVKVDSDGKRKFLYGS